MPMPWIIFLSLSLHALKMHSEIMWHLKSFFLRCCVHKSILTMFTCISMSASFSYLNLHVALYRDILCKVQIWKCKLCSMQVSQEKLVWRLELIWSETTNSEYVNVGKWKVSLEVRRVALNTNFTTIKSNSCACFVYQSLPFRTEYSNRLTVPVLFQKLLQMLLLSKVCLPWQSQVEYGSFEAFNIHPQASGSPPVWIFNHSSWQT